MTQLEERLEKRLEKRLDEGLTRLLQTQQPQPAGLNYGYYPYRQPEQASMAIHSPDVGLGHGLVSAPPAPGFPYGFAPPPVFSTALMAPPAPKVIVPAPAPSRPATFHHVPFPAASSTDMEITTSPVPAVQHRSSISPQAGGQQMSQASASSGTSNAPATTSPQLADMAELLYQHPLIQQLLMQHQQQQHQHRHQ